MTKRSTIARRIIAGIVVSGLLVALGSVVLLPALVASDWCRNYVSTLLTEELGKDVKLLGQLTLRPGFPPELSASQVAIRQPGTPDSEPLYSVAELKVSAPFLPNVLGEYEVTEIRSKGLSIVIPNESEKDSTEKNAETQSSEVQTVPFPFIQKVDLEDFSLVFTSSGKKHRLVFDSLFLEEQKNSDKVLVSSKLRLDGEVLSIKGFTSSIDTFMSAGEALAVDLNLSHGEHRIDLAGSLFGTPSVNLALKASGPDLSELSAFALTELPAWKDYSLTTNISSPDFFSSALNLENTTLNIGDNDLNGTLKLGFSPLVLTANLQSSQFDLGVLSSDSDSPEGSSESSNSEPRIPFEAFKALNATLDVQATQLKTFLGLELKNARLEAQLKAGNLHVTKLDADVFGGSMSASLNSEGTALSAELHGKNLNANPITTLAGGTPIMDGNFELSANLHSKGELLSDVLKTLSGEIRVSSNDAKIKHSTLNTTATGLAEILSPVLGSSKEARSECVVLNYTVKNGIAKSKEQVIHLGDVFIFAKGTLDFPKDKLLYGFHVNSTNPTLVGLIPPFSAVGSIGSPSFIPSVSGSLASVADTAEELTAAPLQLLSSAMSSLQGEAGKELSGVALCQSAYDSEKKFISSRIGSLFESE